MTEKMQEVARSVPPGGAFQGGSLQGLLLWRNTSQAGLSKVFPNGGTLSRNKFEKVHDLLIVVWYTMVWFWKG